MKVAVDSDVIKYIVPKGFIAVDGTSLTICDVHRSQDGSNWFTFMMVAHTQQNVIIPKKEIGELVNIEVDVLAKMVERSVAGTLERIERNSQSLQSLVTEKESLVRSLEATIEEHKLKFVEHDMTINNLLNRLDQLQQLINKNS